MATKREDDHSEDDQDLPRADAVRAENDVVKLLLAVIRLFLLFLHNILSLALRGVTVAIQNRGQSDAGVSTIAQPRGQSDAGFNTTAQPDQPDQYNFGNSTIMQPDLSTFGVKITTQIHEDDFDEDTTAAQVYSTTFGAESNLESSLPAGLRGLPAPTRRWYVIFAGLRTGVFTDW